MKALRWKLRDAAKKLCVLCHDPTGRFGRRCLALVRAYREHGLEEIPGGSNHPFKGKRHVHHNAPPQLLKASVQIQAHSAVVRL